MANEPSYEEDRVFEEEVRRVARLLYAGNETSGPVNVDGKERDGIFVTDELVIAIEATRSRGKEKAKKDSLKLRELTTKLSARHRDKAVKGFFITSEDPTADQKAEVSKAGSLVSAMSFATFESKLIDAHQYLSDRRRYFFGSALDPVTLESEVQGKYIDLDLVELPDKLRTYSVAEIRSALKAGRRVVLLGDFGVGKSMTLREMFLDAMKDRLAGRDPSLMIHLNLRDHQGQTEPVEALERHARLIGFPRPNQLVKAWRSGRATLLLDGFDEISAGNWPGRVGSLSDVRRRSVGLVRHFMEQTPKEAGVLLAGRSHFFDNDAEMSTILSLPGDTLLLSASDLSDTQVRELLTSRQWGEFIPEWLPTRPLLVAHLAARGVLKDLHSNLEELSPALSWDFLIDRLSSREARIDIGIDGAKVREILERLATRARSSSSGLGPLSFEDVTTAFHAVCHYYPDPESYILLQRLPGMQVSEVESNSRVFIDEDLVDSLRAGDLFRYVSGGAHSEVFPQHFVGVETCVGELGLQVASNKLEDSGTTPGATHAVLRKLLSKEADPSEVSLDILRLLLLDGYSVADTMQFSSKYVPSLDFGAGSTASEVVFDDCLIASLDVSEVGATNSLPSFRHCAIDRIDGVAGIDAFTRERFLECTVGAFSDSAANATSILNLQIPDYSRVVVSILQRLFLRSGKGRKELAFYRGAVTEAQKQLIPKILARLQKESIAWPGRNKGTILWSPNRAMTSRVRRILAAPATSSDPLLREE